VVALVDNVVALGWVRGPPAVHFCMQGRWKRIGTVRVSDSAVIQDVIQDVIQMAESTLESWER
jgi:hypothetical protein